MFKYKINPSLKCSRRFRYICSFSCPCMLDSSGNFTEIGVYYWNSRFIKVLASHVQGFLAPMLSLHFWVDLSFLPFLLTLIFWDSENKSLENALILLNVFSEFFECASKNLTWVAILLTLTGNWVKTKNSLRSIFLSRSDSLF